MERKINDERWLVAIRELTRHLETMGRMVEVLDLQVDLQDYPRLSNRMDYEPRYLESLELDQI